MNETISYYILHFLGDISVVLSFAFFYFLLSKPNSLDGFFEIAEYGFQDGAWINKYKNPWYRLDRLWRNITIGMAFVGAGLICFYVCKQMFAWMPHNWRNDDGDWVAESLTGIFTLYSTVALISIVLKVSNKLGRLTKEVECMRNKELERT